MGNPFHLSERPEKIRSVESRIGGVFPKFPQIALCAKEYKMVFSFVFVGNEKLDEVIVRPFTKYCEDALLLDELGFLLGN